MYGLLFFLFSAICGIIHATRMGWLDWQFYKMQRDNPNRSEDFDDYWTDSCGRDISRKTGRPCFKSKGYEHYGVPGHECLIDSKTFNVIKDYTEEKNVRVKNLTLSSDDSRITAYKWVFRTNETSPKIKGDRYIDKETGTVMVARSLMFTAPNANGDETHIKLDFYMSLENGHLLRVTDWEKRNEKRGIGYEYTTLHSSDDYEQFTKSVAAFISDFNAKQDIAITKRDKDPFFEYNFYRNSDATDDLCLEILYASESVDKAFVDYCNCLD